MMPFLSFIDIIGVETHGIHSMMIVLYYYVKIPMDFFLVQARFEHKSLVRQQETLLVELIRSHKMPLFKQIQSTVINQVLKQFLQIQLCGFSFIS